VGKLSSTAHATPLTLSKKKKNSIEYIYIVFKSLNYKMSEKIVENERRNQVEEEDEEEEVTVRPPPPKPTQKKESEEESVKKPTATERIRKPSQINDAVAYNKTIGGKLKLKSNISK
jgi:hypothetical protein